MTRKNRNNMDMIQIKMKVESAIKNQQWREVRDLLDCHGESLQQLLTENCDFQDEPLLHSAIALNAPMDVITQLIYPHNINMQDKDDYTPLHEAVGKKRFFLVPVLLQHGADINLGGPWNRTPLHLASCRDTPADIVTQLTSPHNINMRDIYGKTALHEATRFRKWELVPVLLQHGADIDMSDVKNKTPLHWSVDRDTPANIITQLISPLNINMQDEDGDTALHEAVNEKSWDLVPVLLQYGADPSMLDSPQPGQPLVLSLHALCVATIRSHMPVKSDAAYEGLGLPVKLVAEVKLRPQAEDIVKRGCCDS